MCLLSNGLESPLEGSNRDLIKALSCHFSGITEENAKTLIQDSRPEAEILNSAYRIRDVNISRRTDTVFFFT
jgi:hypothetical protein